MAFEVMFSDKQKDELGTQVYTVVSNAIEKARSDAGIDKMFLNQKEACKYLGITVPTFNKYYKNYLPYHNVNGLIVYSKKEIDEFVFNN